MGTEDRGYLDHFDNTVDDEILSPVDSAKRLLRDNAPYAVVNFGTLDRVEVVPRPRPSSSSEDEASATAGRRGFKLEPPLNALPFGPPPVFPKTKEALLENVESPEKLPIFDLDVCQSFLERKPDPTKLFHWDLAPVRSTVKVVRDPTTGTIQGFREEFVDSVGQTSKNSLAMGRLPGPPEQGVKGSKANLPFWPGGLQLEETVGWLKKRRVDDDSAGQTNSSAVDGETGDHVGEGNKADISDESMGESGREIFETDFLTIAPGMEEGLVFSEEGQVAVTQRKTLQEIIAEGDSLEFEAPESSAAPVEGSTQKETDKREKKEDSELDKIMSKVEVLRISQVTSDDVEQGAMKSANTTKDGKSGNWEWAVAVNVINEPVNDFHERIPEMAYKWPFELDVFQKQAILHLESHQSVFVAAHTSAGKTVIAEYAIALCLKHMTKAIYTSPIKALSNQKFRDFKTTFEDVGLITGDVQINQKAACLIMTTEILRSMLYNGSDVIRDLEWVIFDEVHYINDSERGVVWEEVLIMLPQHVNIVLLSATVPNTLEFADWVGRTKKKKIFVISTLKRPVPLEHFLYTGNSHKTSDELFMILDPAKQFLTKGHQQALAAKKERESKSKESHGAKGQRGGDPRQEKNIYLSVVEMLRKKERLPCVIFTFSKKRCDDNASAITTVDLTTKEEKNEIHVFFNKSISRLRVKADRDLPQILHMGHLLKRGIGVHHSGILPILKEVVEMLFQKGLVKILFATETFAMGVNMPARTVVYDSLKKHDGTGLRFLQPGEYTQMAGRAGRRGLDKTGMVILLCKGDVYEASDLHRVMLGKPFKLESQFRLTYSMILNLLRVEQLRVEDMMKRSFSEFHNQRKKGEFETALTGVKERLSQLKEVECGWCSTDVESYYALCEEYWRERDDLMNNLMFYSHVHKALAHGRLIVFRGDKVDDHFERPPRRQQLGVILNAFGEAADRKFTVLTLHDGVQREADETPPGVEPVLKSNLFYPEGAIYHRLVVVKAVDILVIAHKTIQVESEKIIDNVKKREMPRFAMDPPGKSVVAAVDQLAKWTLDNPEGLVGFDYRRELKTKDIDIVQQLESVEVMRKKLREDFVCVNCDQFQIHFDQTAFNCAVRKEFRELKYRLSDDSLQLLPEYDQRLNVLKELRYVERETGAVQLKGRISCEINNHELMITELILQNVLTPLEPNEIAALMSSMVCQEKRCSEPELNDVLLKGKTEFQRVAREIGEIQKQCGLKEPVEDYVEQFRFGLTEVVFEWAKGTPFGDICNLTDVQEGVIVRCIQRLDETCRDVKNAARLVGDPVLTSKMEQASNLIKRDIVFAASLYTQ